MNQKILSADDIAYIKRELGDFNETISYCIGCIETITNSFDNEVVVESFYASGKFGKEKQEQVMKLRDALIKYRNVLSDTLVSETNAYLQRQLNLVNDGK